MKFENESMGDDPNSNYRVLLTGDQCLGKGAYGYVTLVEEKTTAKRFAMKVIDKKFVEAHGGQILLDREVSIHKGLNHPNIIKLYDFFENEKKVFLVMEYAVNGNLFKQMKKQGTFTEKDAFNIFTQTSLGIDFLHKNKIIHRDLKPENLLLDKKRTIKLCDFGWSAESNNDCRFTFCGTVDYMAPEMVKGQGYSYAVDIWCLGVLLYELLHGYAPFSGKDQSDTMKKIRNKEEIKFHEGLSLSVKDLISNLLTYDQYQRPNLDYIFSHSWVQEFEKTFQIDLNGIRSNYSKKFMGNIGKSFPSFNARENRQTQAEFQATKNSFDKVLTPKKPTNGVEKNGQIYAANQKGFSGGDTADKNWQYSAQKSKVAGAVTLEDSRNRRPRGRTSVAKVTKKKGWFTGLSDFCCGVREI